MRGTELLRLVWLNINQNRFKTIMTSIGIVVGAATIVMVISIGRGGKMDVAEQFASLNAGAIDVSYEWEKEEEQSGGFSFGNMIGNIFGGFGGFGRSSGGGMPGGNMPFGSPAGEMPSAPSGGGMPSGNNMPSAPSGEGMPSMPPGGDSNFPFADEDEKNDDREDRRDAEPPGEAEDIENSSEVSSEEETSSVDDRINQQQVILTWDDAENIESVVSGIRGATIAYMTQGTVEGGALSEGKTYTVAGVKENYLELSNLIMADGVFLTESNDMSKDRICVLGASTAKELFGNDTAVGNRVYIEDRSYTVAGVLAASGTISAGISPDTAILIPYETGIKYITGDDISPTLTVVAEGVDELSRVIADVKTVLSENYTDTEFVFSDAGSKMEAAQSSNETLTLLLSAVAFIVFLVGGIGIMNVLFVSVKERTGEIGILKALGASRAMILGEFLIEAAAISLIGGILGTGISILITPIVESFNIRVEINATALLVALGFAVLTGTVFGIYPAFKASCLEPVDALNQE
ncbi:MAG: ABC transporter permease [Eubacteriales bacterium]|nr:ABC transporter permease [Eubacteriales bacterium]